jgi:hypothetical protein
MGEIGSYTREEHGGERGQVSAVQISLGWPPSLRQRQHTQTKERLTG